MGRVERRETLNAISPNPQGVALPENFNAEAGVLGACLIHPENVEPVFSACRPEDFFHSPHEAIAAAIVALHADSVPVSVLTVSTKLVARAGEFDVRDYLDKLCDMAA